MYQPKDLYPEHKELLQPCPAKNRQTIQRGKNGQKTWTDR